MARARSRSIQTTAAEPKELAQQVTIRRTAYGVPHIKADSLRAVAFGLGYCQAEDHLENIMRSMIRARGELAKTFGGEVVNLDQNARGHPVDVQ